jgi:hypothetical protein
MSARPQRLSPRPKPRRKISRREVLFGLGAAGAGMSVCGITGVGMLVAMGIERQREIAEATRQAIPTATPLTIPTAAPPPPPMISRDAWGALPPDHTAENENGFYSPENPEGWRIYDTPLESTYQTLVIHHSAYYGSGDINSLMEVQSTHREKRKWADVGYHFMVGKGGDIYEGRDIRVRGTHVEGYNTGSLGICLLGNYTLDTITDPQLNAVQVLLNWLVPYLKPGCIASHRDFNAQTECPGNNLLDVVTALALAFGLNQGIGCYLAPVEVSFRTSGCGCGCCTA